MDDPVWIDEVNTPPKYMRYCFVPNCSNDSLKTPDKHFFHVPHKNKAEWCQAVGKLVIPKRPLVICEDHLDLEHDLMNYKKWIKSKGNAKLMPSVPFLKNISRPSAITEAEPGPSSLPKELCTRPIFEDKCILTCTPETDTKSVQVKPATVMVDCGVSCNILPIEAKLKENITFHPSGKGSTSEVSESETYYEPSTTSSATHPQILNGRLFMLNLIEQKPFQYIGIRKKVFWVIESLCNVHKGITKVDVIIILYKIRSNDPLLRIGDLFQISQTTLWRMFEKTCALLSVFFRQFIEWPSPIDIKLNLPGSFTTGAEFARVQAIIDAFEIEIEKPSNPIHQSATWSQYRNCNTVKYLISATPDGLINFISKGYGGRISDVSLVEECGFLDFIPPGSYVLADRGFKHLDTIFHKKSIKLLRPPSVFSDKKCLKQK